ncbi:phage tail tape measure protein [Nocardioides sp. AE5]|uniref:phage tail tape measure protein n=1 Tax=Nocardioides sp. AE5 TaxID=2962573 RepID=UPI0028824734|nr:phage tail tape measure protein [Nocardioides sp. AE5]MDT0201352.1 phage tail tape measure protein [Nocardioides sp. AE5]
MADRAVSYKFQADIGNLKGQLAAAGVSVKDFGTKLTALDRDGERMRAGLTAVGGVATKFGLAVSGGLALTAKAAMDWESAWAGVTKTVDGSVAQMAALEEELRKLATTELPASHTEIAAVAEAAGQLGIARENVVDFTRTMIQLGETTNLSAEDAAISIARFVAVMGTAQGDIDRVGSSVVALGNNFETTEAEIVTLGQRMAAAGAIAGLTEADVLGFAAALSSVGVEAEAGGTAMSKVFTSMRDAVLDGGEKLETFAMTAGMTAKDFAAAWQRSPSQTINSFIQGLGKMNAEGKSTTQVFKDLGLTDQRLMRALLSTAQAGDKLTDALDMSGTAWSENSALADEFAKRLGTSASQVTLAWNGVKDAAIDAGAVLLPIIVEVAQAVSAMAGAWQKVPDGVQKAVVYMAGFGAMAGLGVGALTKLVNATAAARLAMANLRGETDAAAAASTRLFTKSGLARGAGTLAAVGIAASGVGKDIGLMNTAMLGSAGLMVGGPWGGAIGGGIGLLIDFAKSGDQAKAAVEKFNHALDSFDLKKASAAVEDMKKELADLPGPLRDGMSDANNEITRIEDAIAALADVSPRASEAMEALGITTAKWIQMTSLEKLEAEAAIRRWINESGTAEGATKELGKAFGDMADETITASDAVDALKAALDAYLDPAMGAERANLKWLESIRNLKADLAENSRSLKENTDAGQQNREALLDRVDALSSTIASDAAFYASQNQLEEKTSELSEKLREGRQAILDSAEANGLNRATVDELISSWGLSVGALDDLINNLRIADSTNANPNLTVNGLQGALSGLGSALGMLNDIDGKRVSAKIHISSTVADQNVRRLNAGIGAFGSYADGGTVGLAAGGRVQCPRRSGEHNPLIQLMKGAQP